MAVAVMALGAAGCGTGDAGTEASASPVSASPQPRPAGTGPLTKEVVRMDLDSSAVDAGVPANVPEYGGMNEDAEPGSPRSCGLGFKGFATKTTRVDVARWEAVVRELRERDWQQDGEPETHKGDSSGKVFEVRVALKQRGWTLVASWDDVRDGVITLNAFDDACMKTVGVDASPVG
ncbi:hypothetical protein [Actinacidiphila glaucinigra]|uniref:hypothetical protein n=1 Tax=Actinacidiphila glaucinigra TaxID=235986 RepID=UPI0035DB08E9